MWTTPAAPNIVATLATAVCLFLCAYVFQPPRVPPTGEFQLNTSGLHACMMLGWTHRAHDPRRTRRRLLGWTHRAHRGRRQFAACVRKGTS